MKLGDLRRFTIEQAGSNMAGGASDRLVETWINAALARLHAAHPWKHYLALGQIRLDPVATGTGLTVTQDSAQVTLAGSEVFLDRHASERWALYVAGASFVELYLSAVDQADPHKATLDQAWPLASASGKSYSLVRVAYDPPEAAQRIVQIVAAQSGVWRLAFLDPAMFDQRRLENIDERSTDPDYFTYRRDKIEVWPPVTAGRRLLNVTYTKKPPRYAQSDLDSVDVDWRESFDPLLHAAVKLEASQHLGENSQVPFVIALGDYETWLRSCKAEDNGIVQRAGGMTLYGRVESYAEAKQRRFGVGNPIQ